MTSEKTSSKRHIDNLLQRLLSLKTLRRAKICPLKSITLFGYRALKGRRYLKSSKAKVDEGLNRNRCGLPTQLCLATNYVPNL